MSNQIKWKHSLWGAQQHSPLYPEILSAKEAGYTKADMFDY